MMCPRVLRLQSSPFLGDEDIPVERYTSRDWHRREVDRLWRRVWQFACRLEHIPEPGDYVVYEIANLSFVVIRTSTGEIKAYPNACLHRGRRLKDFDGHCSELRCPFHGFAWTLDGELADVPASWDFPHVAARADDDFHLIECKVGTWAGFVFINPDPHAEPLDAFLGDLPGHFESWDLENRYVQAHVSKVINANWKVTQEAFCEAYHVGGTHPQILASLGDTNSQVDVWGNFSRVITPSGTPSPLLGWTPTEDDVWRAMLDVRVDQQPSMTLAAGRDRSRRRRRRVAQKWRPTAGDRVDTMSDAELMDSIDYTLFPNFHPWGAFNRIVYRFRPNGDDHRSSIMEVFFLAPFDGERPPPAEQARARRRRTVDERSRARVARQGVRSGHVQHGQRPARVGGDVQAGHHARQLPGSQDPLAASPARPVGRRDRREIERRPRARSM